ncbi:hypothetical protein H8B02_26860 [Bradyrhizobium sp. Pear77]|uniref:hypothetical protein n=1 Tax=Bradyrhizobium altum TaxID=1571202 RepID=UPI001E49BC7B|nr:hypothetical protein [Bradyrhizobium altum]MCC8956924.1 hypothetical protein [Bradyrhizobium altum]
MSAHIAASLDAKSGVGEGLGTDKDLYETLSGQYPTPTVQLAQSVDQLTPSATAVSIAQFSPLVAMLETAVPDGI